MIPLDQTTTRLGDRASSVDEVEKLLHALLGGDEKVLGQSSEYGIPVLVDAKSLAEHIPLDRSAFLPFLDDLIEDPFEVWLSFEQHKGTGKVILRARFIKAVQLEKGKGLLMAAQASEGQMEAWTFLPTSKWNYLENQRRGKLLWGR